VLRRISTHEDKRPYLSIDISSSSINTSEKLSQ